MHETSFGELQKRYQGDAFTNHIWTAAKAYTIEKYHYHLRKINKTSLEAIIFLENNHKKLWYRSKFSELSKCDYVNNNISESFNSWIKYLKDLHIIVLVDKIRQRLIMTFNKRRIVGAKLQGVILPTVIKELNAKSRNVGR
jgi:mevalonate kinase